ncbi:MAG TPA: SAM hydroxide adenosyltransferase, partial [Candidatus Paceibacterota bacterium]|nr:SAM hydroxide adenosyltransferase [Candidatus Paceibacterota bacterium]
TNVAHRNGDARKNGNGTKFCCFQYGKIWNIATIEGVTLSLVKKLRLVNSLFVIHMSDAVARMVREGFIPSSSASEIVDSQFRSFDFSPRALAYVLGGKKLCCTEVPIESIIPDPQPIIAVIDCFGNGKTMVLTRELNIENGYVQTKFGTLPFYKRLADVPDGVAAVIQGSSGLPGSRFAEIVINGENAAKKLGFKVGDGIF